MLYTAGCGKENSSTWTQSPSRVFFSWSLSKYSRFTAIFRGNRLKTRKLWKKHLPADVKIIICCDTLKKIKGVIRWETALIKS